MGRQRRLVEENVRRAFPEKEETWVYEITRKNFIHTARLSAETAAVTKLKQPAFFDRWVEVKPSVEEYRAILQEGGIFIMGHIGSWEWNGQIAAILLGRDIYTFAKKQSNSWFNGYIEKRRNRSGMQILYLDKKVIFQTLSLLRKKEVVAFISDQYAPNGEYIPFMNRLASTFLGPATFAASCHVPVYFTSSYRNKKGKLVCEIEKLEGPPPPPKANLETERHKWSKEFTLHWIRVLERKIRAQPADYFWFHNRWKNPPENEEEIWRNWGIDPNSTSSRTTSRVCGK